MKRVDFDGEEKYEIVIIKVGKDDFIETYVLDYWQIQEILSVLGKLNLRSAWGS
jgi:hypothetical protein